MECNGQAAGSWHFLSWGVINVAASEMNMSKEDYVMCGWSQALHTRYGVQWAGPLARASDEEVLAEKKLRAYVYVHLQLI